MDITINEYGEIAIFKNVDGETIKYFQFDDEHIIRAAANISCPFELEFYGEASLNMSDPFEDDLSRDDYVLCYMDMDILNAELESVGFEESRNKLLEYKDRIKLVSYLVTNTTTNPKYWEKVPENMRSNYIKSQLLNAINEYKLDTLFETERKENIDNDNVNG